MMNIGVQFPSFELPNQNGETVRLADFKGRKVVLFAYPKAATPGCTKQACGFRDEMPAIADAGAVVLGISPDPPAKLKAFVQKHDIRFPIAHDAQYEVAQMYGVRGTPTTYLISGAGKVIGGTSGPRQWDDAAVATVIQQLIKNSS